MGIELKGTHFLKAPEHIQNTGNRKDLQLGSKNPVCIPPTLPCRTGKSLCPPNHTTQRTRFVVTVIWDWQWELQQNIIISKPPSPPLRILMVGQIWKPNKSLHFCFLKKMF